MKTKFSFSTKEMVIKDVVIPEFKIFTEVEYQAKELVEMWSLFKQIAQESPDVLGDSILAFHNKFIELDKETKMTQEEEELNG